MSVSERTVAPDDVGLLDRGNLISADSGQRLSVLVIAYACSPVRGSEHFLGWEWVRRLSDKHAVTVITWNDSVQDSDTLRSDNLRLIGVDETRFRVLRRFGWPGFYAYYWFWQIAAARLGRQLLAQMHFDIIHQLTFHSFRFHGRLARPEYPPFVWGPIAGLESIPLRLLPLVGRSLIFEIVRQLSNWLSPLTPGVRKTLRNASAILVSNEDTLVGLRRRYPDGNFLLLPANAVSTQPNKIRSTTGDGLLILGVGDFRRMRAHTLVFEALAQMAPDQRGRFRLVMVGDGPARTYLERRSAKLGLERVVEFKGPVPRQEAEEWMLKSDLMVFPSLRDSGGSAICEALAIGLPVLALDRAGPASLLREGGGFLIKTQSRKQTVRDIRKLLLELLDDKAPLVREGRRGTDAAHRLFDWDTRIRMVSELYARAVLKGRVAD